jgi:hypothetical protein
MDYSQIICVFEFEYVSFPLAHAHTRKTTLSIHPLVDAAHVGAATDGGTIAQL